MAARCQYCPGIRRKWRSDHAGVFYGPVFRQGFYFLFFHQLFLKLVHLVVQLAQLAEVVVGERNRVLDAG
jgi:hypothetical protein